MYIVLASWQNNPIVTYRMNSCFVVLGEPLQLAVSRGQGLGVSVEVVSTYSNGPGMLMKACSLSL